MSRVRKSYKAEVETARGGMTGRALISVFNNVDFQGDVVIPGAFKESIARWEASGDNPPWIWSHDWADPFAHLGIITSMGEVERGLEVTYQMDDDTPFVKQVAKLLAERRITEFSFGYDVLDERKREDGAVELLELDFIEGGPTLRGANPSTESMARKAYDLTVAAIKPKSARPATVPLDTPSPSRKYETNDAVKAMQERTRRGRDQELVAKVAALEKSVSISAVASASVEVVADPKVAAAEVDAFFEAHKAEIAAAKAQARKDAAVRASISLLHNLPSEAERDEQLAEQLAHDEFERDAANADRRASAEAAAAVDVLENDDATEGYRFR